MLINQFAEDLKNKTKNRNDFSCKKAEHIVAEIFYAFANALSSQRNYKLSNFYINLSKYLNPDFLSYNALVAENYIMLGKYEEAKKIYRKINEIGSFYKWHASKEIASIMTQQNAKKEATNYLFKIDNNIKKTIFRTFDLANFLKTQEDYNDAIKLYSEILEKIDRNHSLYAKVLDRRGTSYERVGKWELAEQDLLLSLKLLPDQAYTINYLAYTWIEKGKNTEKALKMLKKANT